MAWKTVLACKRAMRVRQSSQSMLNTSKWNLLPDASVNGGIKKDFDTAVETDDVTSSAGFSLSKTISLNDAVNASIICMPLWIQKQQICSWNKPARHMPIMFSVPI